MRPVLIAISTLISLLLLSRGDTKHFYFPSSRSVPTNIYQLNYSRKPVLGDYVLAKLPLEMFPPGQLPPWLTHNMAIKRVVALSGDIVCESKSEMTINGKFFGPIYSTDRENRPLPHWLNGCRTVPDGRVFIGSNYVDQSFDSRYFGPIRQDQLVGVLIPIFKIAEG